MLLLAAVFLGHGLQCGSGSGSSGHARHGDDTAVVAAAFTAADPHLMSSDHSTGGPEIGATASSDDAVHTATVGSAPGHWHGLPGHLWAVCLAVLAAGLAVMLAVLAPRLLGLAPSVTARRPSSGTHWRTPLRPPDLSSLCVHRI